MNRNSQSTILLPISLLGNGTQEIESFPSYLHRVAYDHGVYVGVLLKYLYRSEKILGSNDLDFHEPKYLNPNEQFSGAGLVRFSALSRSC